MSNDFLSCLSILKVPSKRRGYRKVCVCVVLCVHVCCVCGSHVTARRLHVRRD